MERYCLSPAPVLSHSGDGQRLTYKIPVFAIERLRPKILDSRRVM